MSKKRGQAPITINLRLRLEAGIGNTLTDIGHADTTIELPLSAITSSDGATIKVDTDKLTTTITEALSAAQNAIETQTCTNHLPVQHRDGNPPWCNTCGHTTANPPHRG